MVYNLFYSLCIGLTITQTKMLRYPSSANVCLRARLTLPLRGKEDFAMFNLMILWWHCGGSAVVWQSSSQDEDDHVLSSVLAVVVWGKMCHSRPVLLPPRVIRLTRTWRWAGRCVEHRHEFMSAAASNVLWSRSTKRYKTTFLFEHRVQSKALCETSKRSIKLYARRNSPCKHPYRTIFRFCISVNFLNRYDSMAERLRR